MARIFKDLDPTVAEFVDPESALIGSPISGLSFATRTAARSGVLDRLRRVLGTEQPLEELGEVASPERVESFLAPMRAVLKNVPASQRGRLLQQFTGGNPLFFQGGDRLTGFMDLLRKFPRTLGLFGE